MNNPERRLRAKKTVTCYRAIARVMDEPIQDVLTDLVADLFHQYGPQKMRKAIRRARDHYEAETV